MGLAILLVGCGTDRVPLHDAGMSPDAPIDMPTPPAGCDFGELADGVNDFTLGNAMPEATGLGLSDTITICGTVDAGHFDTGTLTVDIDSFVVEAAAPTKLRIELAADAASLASLDVRVLDSSLEVVDAGVYRGTHVAFLSALGAGTYQLAVVASNDAEITAPIPYKLRAIPDPVPCAMVTANPIYAETNDGPQSVRNDVVDVRFAPDERGLTAANNDAPEPTGIVTAAGTDVRISGTSADVDAADDFRDRDTYLIETGADTDELAVRIDWTGSADLDFLVFPENATAEISSGTAVGLSAPETAVFPVLPQTRYWLWVGSYDSSPSLPVDYDISLCPTQYGP